TRFLSEISQPLSRNSRLYWRAHSLQWIPYSGKRRERVKLSQMVQKMAPMKATSVMATAGISASCGDQRLQRILPARALGPACADATTVGDELLSTVNAPPPDATFSALP